MTIDEMKNKISMELRSTDTQLGFEVICKKLTELEKENEQLKAYESHWEEIEEDAKVIAKENEQLKAKLNEYVNIVEDDEVKCVKLQKKIKGLEEQIEKMRCCGNCKNNYSCHYESIDELARIDCGKDFKSWELANEKRRN